MGAYQQPSPFLPVYAWLNRKVGGVHQMKVTKLKCLEIEYL